MKNWNAFIKEFSENILPLYEKHENTFDPYGIHGRLHISRSIIFTEFISKYYHEVDRTAIRYAVAFHDSGRKGNGIDIWEEDSVELCYSYLSKKYNEEYSRYVSSLILKDKNIKDINKQIVYDADVLEIMRPICGHGERDGFRENELILDKSKLIIEDAWKLIEFTENNRELFFGTNHLYKLLEIINENKLGFTILKI